MITFEHPVNEKMRLWLRLESLLYHLFQNIKAPTDSQQLFFLITLNNLLDVLERHDIRGELLQELERQQKRLSIWYDTPGVDTAKLNQLHQQVKDIIRQLHVSPRHGKQLLTDPLISALKRKLILSSVTDPCNLPIVHLWLHQPIAQRHEHMTNWLNSINLLHSSITLHLATVRQLSNFKSQRAVRGFYKDKTNASNLIRLQLKKKYNIFPQISANKNYFTIRFLPCPQSKESIPEYLFFQIAFC